MNESVMNVSRLNVARLNTMQMAGAGKGGITPPTPEEPAWLWADGTDVLWGDGDRVLTD